MIKDSFPNCCATDTILSKRALLTDLQGNAFLLTICSSQNKMFFIDQMTSFLWTNYFLWTGNCFYGSMTFFYKPNDFVMDEMIFHGLNIFNGPEGAYLILIQTY
jgi:hypothetical protein